MTPYLHLGILALLVLAQTTVMASASLGTSKPFLPLIAVVSWTLLAGPLAGAWWALGAGLMLDVVSPSPQNFYTLPLLGVAVLAAVARARLFPANVLIPWVIVALASTAFVLAQRAVMPLWGGTPLWAIDGLGRELLHVVALNLLWLPVVYVPLRALAHRSRGPRIEWER